MKKLALTIAVLFLFSSGMVAQVAKPAPVAKKTEKAKQVTDCCMMKNGKMYHYKDGKEMPIVKEMTFHGMKVMPDGTCKMKDGKIMKLKEGECCDAKGVLQKDCAKMMMMKKG
jgi:hypothetical protein